MEKMGEKLGLAEKPTKTNLLPDLLIDCSENRIVKKLSKCNSKTVTQLFDSWNGDTMLRRIKHAVNGGRSNTGTNGKTVWTYAVFFAKFLEAHGNSVFYLCVFIGR